MKSLTLSIGKLRTVLIIKNSQHIYRCNENHRRAHYIHLDLQLALHIAYLPRTSRPETSDPTR